jgi:hypothetical protein
MKKCILYGLVAVLAALLGIGGGLALAGWLDAPKPHPHYYVDPIGVPLDAQEALGEAMAEWNEAYHSKPHDGDFIEFSHDSAESNVFVSPWDFGFGATAVGVAFPLPNGSCLLLYQWDEGQDLPEILAHELGHCFYLPHDNTHRNLMQANGMTGLKPDQANVAALRAINPYF